MKKPHFKQVAIIGVGLIGGSLGMILRRQNMADSVVGIGRRVENLKTAVEVGAIDRYVSDPREGVEGADFVLLATPVDTYERHLQEWAGCLKPGTIVSDVGSVKGDLVTRSEALLPPAVRFVGAHPIAGKEKTGVAAGSETLFTGARCILTPTAKTDPDALQIVRAIWELAGSIVLEMDPFLHDKILGAVSHLPHVAALLNTASHVSINTNNTGPIIKKELGYYAGAFKKWDAALALSYRRKISDKIGLAALSHIGLIDIKSDNFFSKQKFERNVGLIITLTYDL